MLIEASTVRAYPRLVDILSDNPVQESRNGDTKELLNVTIQSNNPRERFIMRDEFNLAFCLQECWAYWQGRNPGFVQRYNSQMENYMDDDGMLDGSAYGERLRHSAGDQIRRIIAQLQDNEQTRRAIMMIHQPHIEDYTGDDVACTLDLHPIIRDGKLHLTVHMRSQDIYWGFPYDVQAFQWIQEVLAGILDVELGTYTHHIDSLHYYMERESAVLDSVEIESFDTLPCDLEPEELAVNMSQLTTALAVARSGRQPSVEQMHPYYRDWANVMFAYEQHRYHDDYTGTAEIEHDHWRQWINNLN